MYKNKIYLKYYDILRGRFFILRKVLRLVHIKYQKLHG